MCDSKQELAEKDMACPLTGSLYKVPPRNPCLEESYPGCNAQVSSDAAISSVAHRCMEQSCYAVGSCLMQPCESLRPIPRLGQLDVLSRSCQNANPEDSLLCAFLSLDDYQLYYESYEPQTGVKDCWQGLERTLSANPEAYSGARVWEQIGYALPNEAPKALSLYNSAYEAVIQDSAAGAM